MSQNLHEALDNLESTVASLAANLDLGTQGTLLEVIGENIDAIRVAIETHGVAEITAQNSNFNDLIGVLGMLKLVCQSVTNVSVQNYFTPIQQPADPGGEGIPAPEGFEDLELEPDFVADRKCFMANKIVDELANWFDKYDGFQADEIGNIGFISFMAIWVAGLVTVAAESPLLAKIASTVSPVLPSIANYAYNNIGLLEFSTIHAAILARRDDLVCALFEAPDVNTAKNDFAAVLTDEALDLTNRTMAIIILEDDFLNHLFYKGDDQAEAEYQLASGYSCPGCDEVCGNVPSAHVTIIQDTGTLYELGAGPEISGNQGNWYAGMNFDATEDKQLCGGSATISNVSVTSGVVSGVGSFGWRFWDHKPAPNDPGNLYHSSEPPTGPISGVRFLLVTAKQDFAFQFDWTED